MAAPYCRKAFAAAQRDRRSQRPSAAPLASAAFGDEPVAQRGDPLQLAAVGPPDDEEAEVGGDVVRQAGAPAGRSRRSGFHQAAAGERDAEPLGGRLQQHHRVRRRAGPAGGGVGQAEGVEPQPPGPVAVVDQGRGQQVLRPADADAPAANVGLQTGNRVSRNSRADLDALPGAGAVADAQVDAVGDEVGEAVLDADLQVGAGRDRPAAAAGATAASGWRTAGRGSAPADRARRPGRSRRRRSAGRPGRGRSRPARRSASGVGIMALPRRSKSRAPSSASSLRICWLTAPWVTASSCGRAAVAAVARGGLQGAQGEEGRQASHGERLLAQITTWGKIYRS